MSAPTVQYRGPMVIPEEDPDYILKVRCDWRDPLNPEKNNIVLDRAPPDFFLNEKYHVRWRDAEEGKPTLFTSPACSIAYSMIAPYGNLADDFPGSPSSVVKQMTDLHEVSQKFALTGHAHHPSLRDKNDPFKRLKEFNEWCAKEQEIERWKAACKLTDTTLGYSKRKLFLDKDGTPDIDKMMENSSSHVYVKRDIPANAKPKGAQRNEYPKVAGTEIFYFNKPAFIKMNDDMKKKNTAVPSDPVLAVAHQRDLLFMPPKVFTIAENAQGELSTVRVVHPEAIRRLTDTGMVCFVRFPLTYQVKGDASSAMSKWDSLVVLQEPELAPSNGGNAPEPEPSTIAKAKASGFTPNRLTIDLTTGLPQVVPCIKGEQHSVGGYTSPPPLEEEEEGTIYEKDDRVHPRDADSDGDGDNRGNKRQKSDRAGMKEREF